MPSHIQMHSEDSMRVFWDWLVIGHTFIAQILVGDRADVYIALKHGEDDTRRRSAVKTTSDADRSRLWGNL